MIQRPKTTPSGLKEEDHKKLVIELTKYAEEGASDSELKQFRETFISQKKKSIQEQKSPSESNIPQKQKKFALESSSEDGSLVSQKSPKPNMPVLTQEGFEQAMSKKKAVPTDMSGKALMPKTEERKPKKVKESSLWDDAVDFAKDLFSDSEEDSNGKLVYYEQTPIKEQQEKFKKDSKDAMNAVGKFEFLKDYKPEDRALFVSKLVPKTNYTEKKYNQETNVYEVKPKRDAVDYVKSNINPKDFKTKEQMDKAINLNIKKLASQDSAFEFEQSLAKAKATPLIKQKALEIQKKYELTNPEEVAKATKELQNYAMKTTNDFLINSEGFQRLNKQFLEIENEATQELTKSFGREQDWFLSGIDFSKNVASAAKEQGVVGKVLGGGLEAATELTEGVGKGVENVIQSTKQSLISANHNSIKNLNDVYSNIKDKPDNEPIDRAFANEWDGKRLRTYDPKEQDVPKTYGEAKARLKKYLSKTNNLVNERVQDIENRKEYIGLFNQADLKDGVQLKDIFQLVGEQVPNMALTTTGVVTGNPYIIGLSAANMFTQTYGPQYYGAIETGLKEDLGREPSKEEIAEAIGEGKYADRGEAAAWAALSAATEYAGELNVIKNTGKALGFGDDAKNVIGSLFRGEIKNFGKSALNNAKNISSSALGEYLTESMQTAIEQVSLGTQVRDDATKYLNLKEINEAGMQGGLIGAVFPFAGSVARQTGVELTESAKKVATAFDLSNKNVNNLVQVDSFFKSAVDNVEERFKLGEITEEQRQNEIDSIGAIRNAGTKIPSTFSEEAKKKSLDLILEKTNIEKEIEGKDAALVVKQKNRIAEINNELTKLSETDAVQEQSTTEVPVQSETITSETLETGVSQPGPEVVTEQGTQEEVTPLKDVESTTKALESLPVEERNIPLSPLDLNNEGIITWNRNDPQSVAEAYHRAKEEGSNPGFVKAIEELLAPKATEQATQEVTPSETITTEQEEVTPVEKTKIYHGGQIQDIDSISDTEPLFVTQDKDEAVSYAKGNDGNVSVAEIDISKIGSEDVARDILKDMGYSDEYMLHELIDSRFEDSYIGDENVKKLYTEIEKQGYVGISFMDTGIGNKKNVTNIFLINPKQTLKDSGLNNNVIVREKNAYDLLEEGFSPVIDGNILENITEDELGEFFRNSETIEMTKSKPTVTPTEQVIEPQAEASPVVEEKAPAEDLNELLTLDTKDKTNLKRIYDYLDNLDSALDLDPNELNDVTRVMAIGTAKAVVKTLKELINVGITLQEAINRAAEIHSVKTEDVLKAFQVIKQGGKQKSAPSPVKSDIYVGEGRIISMVKDIKKITMTEKALLVKQIRDKITGAKDVIKTTKEISKQLVKDIKELESTGKITPTQALNMISKFNKVNMLNEVSVSNFIDYMSKVFADADYDNKINVAKGKLKAAKKNINTKIGIADGLVGPLQKLFAINPELIPEPYLEKYLELVDMFGARQAVLNLEEKSKVTKDVIEILNEINNERSAVDELSERFNYSENQVIENGKINYAATVKNMLKEGEITEEESALMTKYKSEIGPKVKREERTEEEIQEEKDQLLAEVKKSTINSDDLPTRTERDAAKKLATLIKSPGAKELSNAQLKNLLKVIDNINNGYFAHSAHLIIEEINSINNSKVLESSVNKAKLLPLSKLYSQAKSILTRKDAVLEMIRRNPLFNIDQVLGDFKTKDVFNSILEKAAEAEAKFTAELKAIQLKLANAEEKIAKSFKLDPNKTLMSKFKIMTYMVQLEYESNPDSKQVNPASKFIEATINHINEGKSQFGEKDAEMLQDILDNYTDADGNIDVKKLYNSFNSAEKAGVKTIQEVNQSLKEKAEYTASVIRGQRINPLSNYIHLNVLSDTKPNDLTSGESFADQYNNSLKPSTKAKSLIERTGKVSPLNFDVFASAQKGAKSVLMDYHLTEPIRTGRKTINKTIASLGKIDKEKRKIINAINKSFEESVENLVNNSYIETSVGDDVADYIKKQGYRSVLAGTGRFAAEFLSNVGFVIISDPITFAEGLKYTSILMSPDAPSIMNNVNSKEINRIFPSDTLSGRLIDTNILSEANGIKGGKAKNRVINKAQQIWNLTGKKYKNAVELTADVLITTPDKAIMRPIWFGSFATNFKKETGKDVDFEKIAANDEAYISENKEAIDKSRDAADERSVITGASNNAFTGILKGTSKPNQSNFIKGFNNFNNFMSRFLIYEYTSARTGIMAAMGNGSLSRKEGIALLGAVTTRMTVYSLLAKALGGGLIGLLFGDDDEEDEKSLDKSIGQALTSTFTSLLFNRDFGNATKSIINYGLERINENYLQALREGDYDPYKDAIQYSTIPMEKKGKQTGVYDYVESAAGAYGPAIKTTNLIIKTYSEEDKKEADAIQRQKDVKNIRIPLEVLGNAGFIPLYKDIRKEVMKEIYKGIEKGPSAKKRRVMSQEEYDRLTK